ncbi:GAF domain-containing protein [Actinoplanes regularis]|uniref:PAS domain S-box-containing protein n=1 Tax=Actinoplanes regularis TaxID=52697 RepID=A0A239K6R9_9ACTN|nr:GAF domain-containing protein [Actinoplanes regularis]GIE92406.1 hypothetical protein Are01nite_88860 [Actinoplanes regularis]SNT12874.1 PAS domain S-box-containing protein [Actinoplanes regularis]
MTAAAPADVAGSEELLGLFVDAVAEYAIFLVDADGTVSAWNTGADRLHGYHDDQIIGRHFSVFYPAEDVAAGRPARDLAVAARDGVYNDDGWRVRADGTRFWAHVVITALFDGDRLRGFAEVTRDDTAARAVRARVETLTEITNGLLAEHESSDTLASIAAHARLLLGADQAWISSPAEHGKVRIRAADGCLAGPEVGAELPLTGTVTAQVLAGDQPILIDDLASRSPDGDFLTGMAAVLAAPLVAGPTTIGVLVVAVSAGGPRFRPEDLEILREFAARAALLLEYERAQQTLRERDLIGERERIATDLHADVIRELSWTGMTLQTADGFVTSPQAHERIEEAVERLDATIRRIRQVIFELPTGQLSG